MHIYIYTCSSALFPSSWVQGRARHSCCSMVGATNLYMCVYMYVRIHIRLCACVRACVCIHIYSRAPFPDFLGAGDPRRYTLFVYIDMSIYINICFWVRLCGAH